MAEPIIMPKLAMAMQEGAVVEWLVDEDAYVEKSQPVMVVETEKVTYECEAPASGYLKRLVELGVTVPVFREVALLARDEEELARLAKRVPSEMATPATSAAPPIPVAAPIKERIPVSPVAKKLARANSLDLSRVAGSGPGGRIVKADVERALTAREAAAHLPETMETPNGMEIEGMRVLATIPFKGMRRSIADHMVRSLSHSAQLTQAGEIDMSEMIHLRRALLEKEEETRGRITYTDLFVYVLSRAVRHVPIVNSSLVDDEIRVWADVNVGIAVALDINEYESGLIVPVVKHADRKSLGEISAAVRDLTARARAGRLVPEDVSGRTITLSNAGQFASGWSFSTPILNAPEAVIVQPGGIAERPVVVGGEVVVRPMVTMSITFDHRIMDGVAVARFFAKLKELIETPALLHL
jgi:pyruvate dehydrogenase E2 component (dihydrolipoamide acetyltransferase)